jgi:transcriptional regulator with XRE-family HTH domain
MREKTIKVDTTKLNSLSDLYRPSKIARQLGISKQRWRNYEIGKNDIPESVFNKICSEFNLNEKDLAVGV